MLDPEVFINYSFFKICRKFDLNATQMSVYLILVGWYKKEDGYAGVSQRQFCKLLGLDPKIHRKTVQRTLKTLETLGLIKYWGYHKNYKTDYWTVCNYELLSSVTPEQLIEV